MRKKMKENFSALLLLYVPDSKILKTVLNVGNWSIRIPQYRS